MCAVDWGVVVEILKILPTPIVALLVGLVAYRQWLTAKDKLALDLFDRRLEMHRKLLLLFDRMKLEKLVASKGLLTYFYSRAEEDIKREIEEARFLFGGQVSDQLHVVREAIRASLNFQFEIDQGRYEDLQGADAYKAVKEYGRLQMTVTAAVETYIVMIEPFMMFDTISVNRPQRRLRWYRRVRR